MVKEYPKMLIPRFYRKRGVFPACMVPCHGTVFFARYRSIAFQNMLLFRLVPEWECPPWWGRQCRRLDHLHCP